MKSVVVIFAFLFLSLIFFSGTALIELAECLGLFGLAGYVLALKRGK